MKTPGEHTLTRRDFIKAGACLAAGVSIAGLAGCTTVFDSEDSQQPDIVVILTDQERYPAHFPDGWVDKYAPSWARLKKHGITFNRAYTAASQCSPSRACIMTGEYSNVNKVPLLGYPYSLPDISQLPNVASVMAQAGYDVVWKGKWHLSFPVGFQGGSPDDEVWTAADIPAFEESYGMEGWDPPDAGTNVFNTVEGRKTLGGGTANNDGRFVEGVTTEGQTPGYGGCALDYLDQVGAIPRSKRKPFCLFVSLVNPHDVSYYPDGWDEAGYRLEDFENLGIQLPDNYDDSLDTKPGVQKLFRKTFDTISPLTNSEEKLFVNFYAYLHKVVDSQVTKVLDKLDSLGLTDDTIIFRTADHGEMGLSHGLREKCYSAYEEMIHVPLVISNPKMFPIPVETDSYYSHIDFLATVCELGGAKPVGVGKSAVPVLMNPKASVQDSVLFAYDDSFVLPENTPTSHIRALRYENWTYAVYYSPDGSSFEFELYDNENDPGQLTNLLYSPSAGIDSVWRMLHKKLTTKLKETNSAPEGFIWPSDPTVV